jgi:site-specific DNA-methyltransferase (cytosine-N4-specific)
VKDKGYSTHEVAAAAGVHRDTLLRWLREGRVREPQRDRNGWRSFTADEVQTVIAYASAPAEKVIITEPSLAYATLPFVGAVDKIRGFDWDFKDANTGYLTHTLHPYPAKFIPQIPNTLIQELSSVGEVVLDPFCGSGTTLVEAMRLGRYAVGVDANPLACMISRAKTSRITGEQENDLRNLALQFASLAAQTNLEMNPLFPELISPLVDTIAAHWSGISEWFDAHVISELLVIKERSAALPPGPMRDLALTAFSAIIVGVSRQDSDTRYVRRDKKIPRGETFLRFSRTLLQVTQRAVDFTNEVDRRWQSHIYEANALSAPKVGNVDLVVCSPPYPNAYSYHLYHRTRMLWLDMDQPRFKQEEIGSHRKYSRKGPNSATADTFAGELALILNWLRQHLHWGRHACFVIGDSIINGQTVRNDELLITVAEKAGFVAEANIERNLQSSRKSFNPAIGKIKREHIVVLRNEGKA